MADTDDKRKQQQRKQQSRITQFFAPSAAVATTIAAATTSSSVVITDHPTDPPLAPPRLLVVDLFCGAGGFSCGSEWLAGGKVVLGVDTCPRALATFGANFGSAVRCSLPCGPKNEAALLEVIDNALATKRQSKKRKRKWHLHCSPPCQQLTKNNTRRTDSAMQQSGCLMRWCVAFATERAKPTSWSLEQVDTGVSRAVAASAAAAAPPGTCAWTPVQCSDLGVPQSRRRLIMGDPASVARLREAMASTTTTTAKAAAATALPRLDPAVHLLRNNTDNIKVFPPAPWMGIRHCHPHECTRELSRPAFTVCCKPHRVVRADTEREVRLLTEHESAALQGFPASFKWNCGKGDKRATQHMIGNAVPPPLAAAVLLGRPSG